MAGKLQGKNRQLIQDMTRHGRTGQGKTRQDKARQDKTRFKRNLIRNNSNTKHAMPLQKRECCAAAEKLN
jgi:hypothetical protein